MTIKEAIFKQLRGDVSWFYDAKFLSVISKMSGESLKRVKIEFRNMLSKGEVKIDVTNKISSNELPKEMKKGIIRGNAQGYAFCDIIGSDEPDYFIAPSKLNGAVNKDIVLIQPTASQSNGRKNPEAEVVEIVERGNSQIVGVFYPGNGYEIVQPCDDKFAKKIILEKGVSKISANPGDRVVVKLLTQPKYEGAWTTGEIIENLGPSDSIEALVLSIVREHNIIEEFPQEVIDYCGTFKKPSAEQIAKRKDLRALKTFTIDGADARDLDDAISITKLDNGHLQLGVHIADVGEYVQKGNPIDLEAFQRGTSVYFPAPVNAENSKIRPVIPMLPVALSNDLCSLNPHTDKLTISCFMEMNENGDVVEGPNTFVSESVIKTCHRLTYDQVKNLLDGDKVEAENLADIKNELFEMKELSDILTAKRKREGSLDLDLPEPEFIFDDNSNVIAVKERHQDKSHKLIENFMVAANETVAKMFKLKNVPFVYRVHELPDQEKLKMALSAIQACSAKDFGPIPEKVSNQFLEGILNASDDPIVNQAINSMVLRAMKKAVYSPECLGHFGLGLEYYCHFTSPIRRYPDLTIHRIIKDYIHGKVNQSTISSYEGFVAESAEQSSICEQNAEKLEREVDDLWCCQYLKDKVGQEFDVVVSSVMGFGAFVKIPNTAIEGLIKLESMSDKSYIYDEEKRVLVGSSSKFAIGDKVRVKLENVNMLEREIDFGFIKSLNKEGDFNAFIAKNKIIGKTVGCEKTNPTPQRHVKFSYNNDREDDISNNFKYKRKSKKNREIAKYATEERNEVGKKRFYYDNESDTLDK